MTGTQWDTVSYDYDKKWNLSENCYSVTSLKMLLSGIFSWLCLNTWSVIWETNKSNEKNWLQLLNALSLTVFEHVNITVFYSLSSSGRMFLT